MSAPRICIVSANYHPYVGGLESQALSHVDGLRQRGYSVIILTLRHSRAWPRHEEMADARIVRVAGTPLALRARLPRFTRKPLYFLSVMTLAGALWRYRRQYDIAHVYQLTILATLCALVCLLNGKRMVVAVQGIGTNLDAPLPSPRIPTLPAVTDGHRLAPATRPVGGDLAQLWQFGKPAVQITYALLRLVNAVVLVLSTRAMAHLATYGFAGIPVFLLPNGVDTKHFAPVPARSLSPAAVPAERIRTVACVSRLVRMKGLEDLLHAWQGVREQAPWSRLILVGDGPLRPQLEHLVDELGLQNHVEFAGEQPDVRPYLWRAAVAVLPSYAEGLSIALLEAMACGLPCVATRVSGSEDVIQHEINGLLVEPGDVAILADALLTLLCDPALAQRQGQKARATIEAHYSRERILDQHEDLYRKIMDARRRPTRHAQHALSH